MLCTHHPIACCTARHVFRHDPPPFALVGVWWIRDGRVVGPMRVSRRRGKQAGRCLWQSKHGERVVWKCQVGMARRGRSGKWDGRGKGATPDTSHSTAITVLPASWRNGSRKCGFVNFWGTARGRHRAVLWIACCGHIFQIGPPRAPGGPLPKSGASCPVQHHSMPCCVHIQINMGIAHEDI